MTIIAAIFEPINAEHIDKLFSEASLARLKGRFGDARRVLIEAIRISRKGKDQRRLARGLAALGTIEYDLHNDEAALHLYEEAAETYRELNDSLKLANTVRRTGDILRQMNRFAAASMSYTEAVGIYRAQKEPPLRDLANTLRGFALLKEAAHDNAEAKALWEEAGILYAEINVETRVSESARRVAKLEKQNRHNTPAASAKAPI